MKPGTSACVMGRSASKRTAMAPALMGRRRGAAPRGSRPSAAAAPRRGTPKVRTSSSTVKGPWGAVGRSNRDLAFFPGVYRFGPNKTVVKGLIAYPMQGDNVWVRYEVAVRSDIPSFNSRLCLHLWEDVAAPKWEIYDCPIRPFHKISPPVAAARAPPEIAVEICNRGTMPTLLAERHSGQSVDKMIGWASDELAGLTR